MKDIAIPRSMDLKCVQPHDRANLTSLIFHLGELGLMTSPTSTKFWNSKMACCQHLGVHLPTCITCIRRPWRRRRLHCRSCNMPQDFAPATLFLFVSNTPTAAWQQNRHEKLTISEMAGLACGTFTQVLSIIPTRGA